MTVDRIKRVRKPKWAYNLSRKEWLMALDKKFKELMDKKLDLSDFIGLTSYEVHPKKKRKSSAAKETK